MELTEQEKSILEDMIIRKEIEYQHSYDLIFKYESTTKECYDFYHKKISELSAILQKIKQ